MDGFGIDFDFKAFNGKLDELGKAVIDVMSKALIEAGEQLRLDSVAVVPFKRGFAGGLAGSASTQLENGDDGMQSVIVGYNMPYAARLHEDMTLNISQKYAGGGKRRSQKYLETPARENAQKYGKILAEAFHTYLNG